MREGYAANQCDRRPFFWERHLQRFFSSFPDRWPGVGLALLRALVGGTAAVQAASILIGSVDVTIATIAMSVLGVVSGLSLLAGMVTPLAAMVAAASLLFLSPAAGGVPVVTGAVALYLAAVAAAIMLLGPGAWSIDARLFGRREIVFPHPPASRS